MSTSAWMAKPKFLIQQSQKRFFRITINPHFYINSGIIIGNTVGKRQLIPMLIWHYVASSFTVYVFVYAELFLLLQYDVTLVVIIHTRKGFLASIKWASRWWELLGDDKGDCGGGEWCWCWRWPLMVAPNPVHDDVWLLAAQGPWQGSRQASWPRTAGLEGAGFVAPTTSTAPVAVVVTVFLVANEDTGASPLGCCWW